MSRPLLLDLYSGAGGAAVGYHRAGFDVVGVDIRPQPRYPFDFIQGDALQVLERLTGPWPFLIPTRQGRHYQLRDFAAIHASPPCQRYSQARFMKGAKGDRNPDLIDPTRQMLVNSGRIWVIENVENAPLGHSAKLCGLALGLRVKRHRLFESNVLLLGTQCPIGHRDSFITNFGHDIFHRRDCKAWVSVHGGGSPATTKDGRRRASVEEARLAMGIDWMTRDELSQAIPPAYCEFVGKQLLAALENEVTS